MRQPPRDTPMRTAFAQRPVLFVVALVAICAMALIGVATMLVGMSI